MRTIILASSFLFLVFGAVADAQEIYMNCKFFKGYYKGRGSPVENVTKDIDLSLVLNKNKKTVRSSTSHKDEKYLETLKDQIDWHEKNLGYSLNLINGNLSVSGDAMPNVFQFYNYQCEKTMKKF